MDRAGTVHAIREITAAFDRHDLERIMSYFAEDAVFDGPRGPDPWGQRFVGRDEVAGAFAGRFAGIPNVRYTNDEHFVDGDRGASTWTLTGRTVEGQELDLRGCDLWTFRGGLVVKKDSYWKIRTG
ncbi:MAG TPA: nuclear transport factor 2 family protein [Candidatus Sulfotelmatobacter sp.]|nr:nuclear transport factor 2 family protein [Candidatus Sulfotelmatobacter sp.]